MYLIREDQVERYKIPKEQLEKVFDFVTYDDIRTSLEELGSKRIEEERLNYLKDLVLTKFDSDNLERIIEYLKYKIGGDL